MGLQRSPQNLLPERHAAPVLVLAKDHKNGFARIGEHVSLHEFEHPFGKTGWQIDFKTQARLCALVRASSWLMLCRSPFPLPFSSLVPLLRSYNPLR